VIWVFVLVPPALVITGAVIWANFLTPRGAHAFPDPADRTDPDGDNYVTALRDDSDGFWEQHAPRGTGQFPMLPPDPDPEPTLIQPADVAYLGKPSGEYVDDLFAKHATPPEMIP